jgi:amino acid adenylation domain-containing protein
MTERSKPVTNLDLEQTAIRAKCFHPSGTFVEFKPNDIERSIPDRFEQIARHYPNRIAIKSRNETITFDELNRSANQIARKILTQQCQHTDTIGLLLGQSWSAIASMLGVLKAGKIYVPMDPSYPRARLLSIAEHSQTSILLTDDKNLPLAKELLSAEGSLVNVEALEQNFSFENPGLVISPEQAAAIFYTSGSTGQPKGVIQNHRNVLHRVMIDTNNFHICQDDHLSLLSSPSYSVSLRNLFGALLNGAAVCPFDIEKERMDDLAAYLVDQQITIFFSVPSVFRQFVGSLGTAENFGGVRLLYLAGESAATRDVELYKNHFSNAVLVNSLASNEAGIIRQYFIDHETQFFETTVPAGYPVDGKEVLIFNDDGQEAGLGEVGEIAVKSRYLSPGYWRNPDLTEGAFQIESADDEQRIYRTGDLGYLRPDGCLVHLGRKGLRVKIRGSRVELAEVEATLLQHPRVRETVVDVMNGEANNNRLIAYVVPFQAQAPTTTELRKHLQTKLPQYMIPSRFFILESLPLLPNGKVNRHALPSPDRITPESNVPYAPHKTRLEKTLAEFWSKLLGAKRVGIYDNFFDLGGDSLLAVQLFAEIEKTFKQRLPLSSLFEDATIDHLVNLLNRGDSLTSSSPLLAIRSEGSKKPFFCVHGLFGDVLCYMNLARYLDQDRPFYALQAIGVNDGEEPLDDIEAIAAHHVEQIRTVQPQGPYALGGLCFGGVVAFEMAQQLLSKGEPVSLVALLDSNLTSKQDRSVWWWNFLRNLPRDFPAWLVGALQLNRAQWSTLIKQKISMTQAALYDALRSSANGSQQDNTPLRIRELGDFFQFSKQHRKVAQAQYRAFREYKPRPYPGRLTLFRARMQPLFSSHAPDSGWEWLAAGGLEIRVVPGNHLGMLQEPHVQVLAQQLRDCLGRV